MNLKGIVCVLIGHVPYHRPRKHKWHKWCKRCGKELVAHKPEPKVAPYKVEPGIYLIEKEKLVKLLSKQEGTTDPIVLAKAYPDGEGLNQEET